MKPIPSAQAMRAAEEIRRLNTTVADFYMAMFGSKEEDRAKCEEIIVRKMAEIIDTKTVTANFVAKIEENYFRTNEDVGASLNVLLIWNQVRQHLGLEKLEIKDLRAHCKTHDEYHVIQPEDGCERTRPL
jgi:hypothetical protein